MQPDSQQNNGMWISREEYDRLRQAEQQAGQYSQVVSPVVQGQPQAASTKASSGIGRAQIICSFVLSAVIFWSFTSSFAPLLLPVAGGLLVIFAGLSVVDLVRVKREPADGLKPSKSAYKLLIIIGIIVFAAPMIFIVGGITLIIIVCTFGGCSGS